MRRMLAATMAAILVVVAAGPVTAARTYSIQVKAAAGWTGTGFWTFGNETLSISANGSVKTISTPGAISLDGVPPTPTVGPAGGDVICADAGLDPLEWGDCLVPDAPFGALVGMLYGQTFLIGDSGSIVIPGVPAGVEGAQLYLGVNDVDHTFFDNYGSFTITLRLGS